MEINIARALMGLMIMTIVAISGKASALSDPINTGAIVYLVGVLLVGFSI